MKKAFVFGFAVLPLALMAAPAGIFTRDRRPYPAAAALKAFAAMQEKLPFASLPKARTDAVVLTTDRDTLFSSYILSRQAGIFPLFANPEEKLPDANIYFLPDAHGRAFLTIERWEALKAKVPAPDGQATKLSQVFSCLPKT